MTTYPCGCINEIHEPSGILRNVSKCRSHKRHYREPSDLGESYYKNLLPLDLADSKHVAELTEALGPIPSPNNHVKSLDVEHGVMIPKGWKMSRLDGNSQALEVGCGASPYVGAIQEAGWLYTGTDASPWATEWTANRWGVMTFSGAWERWHCSPRFGLILSAHALEHMPDAPLAIGKMACSLTPGGELWLVVPDDTDPLNPHHFWFFTLGTLRRALEVAGLKIEALESRRIVKHEQFLYARAVKPSV